MQIFLVRHAIAEDRGPEWEGRDDERPLTRAGIRKFRKAASGLRRLKLEPAVILTSPLIRAAHTAELLQAGLKRKDGVVRVSEALRPERPARPPEELRELAPDAQVVLVGHEPNLGRLASWLLAGHEELRLSIKKGGVALLSMPDPMAGGTAVLEALLTQRHLRRIG
jgi:phosphohistidine phosphatase